MGLDDIITLEIIIIRAIAAGNVVILKPSECSPHSAEVMFRLFAKYMDQVQTTIQPDGTRKVK